jgi:hypothetical protein
MPESTAASSRRVLIALSGLVVALTGVGAALELARRTSAGLAIYARIDTAGADSVKANLIGIDASTTKVLFGVLLRWPARDLDGLAAELAEHVRHNHALTGH